MNIGLASEKSGLPPKTIRYYEEIELIEYGKTDIGKPLHLVVISKDKEFSPQAIKSSGKRVFMINNGIHAGEPCGIDASMMLARDLMKAKTKNLLSPNSHGLDKEITKILAYSSQTVKSKSTCLE